MIKNKWATALTKQREWANERTIKRYNMVDSNGAIDIFFGFLFAYMQGKEVRECFRYSAVCGAEILTSKQLTLEKLNPLY